MPPPERGIAVPETVIRILQRLEEGGYETWCVGGAIRDALLGNPGQDVDLATAARPEVVRRLFPRTIPVGIEHGTVGVLDEDGVLHEVTTFRRDVRTDGRHAEVEFGVSLEDDLARRDFTINAIAWHPLRNEWRDPFHGRAALADRTITAVGDPTQRFREDRLRILRALRFAARFEFEIAAETWEAARAEAPATTALSAERVREEWLKGLRTAAHPERLVALWHEAGVAAAWLPELLPARPWTDLPREDLVRATALLVSRSGPVWRRLKGSNAEIRRADAIDAGPPRPASASARDVRHWMAAVEAAADDLAWLAEMRGENADGWTAEVAAVRARGEATSRAGLAVTGADLLAVGLPPGPALGAALSRLLQVVLDEPARNTRDALLAIARGAR